MRIFSKGTLRKFWQEYPDARPSLEFWYDTVENTPFQNPNEVINHFNIASNKYRLIAKFQYEIQFVFVLFIGTHKEYDKIHDIANI